MNDSREFYREQIERNRLRFGTETFPGGIAGQWPGEEFPILQVKKGWDGKMVVTGGKPEPELPEQSIPWSDPRSDPLGDMRAMAHRPLQEVADLPPVDNEPLWEG